MSGYRFTMAKPPDGQSSWFHHSDLFMLTDCKGTLPWASISSEVSDPRVTISFSKGGSPFDHSPWLQLEIRDGRNAGWTHVSPTRGYRPTVRWTVDTPKEQLFEDEAILDTESGAPLATAALTAPGRVTVRDRDGRARIELMLGEDVSGLEGTTIELPREAPIVRIVLAGPMTGGPASMP